MRCLSRMRFRRRWGGRPPGCIKTMATNSEVKILTDANAIAQTAAAEFLQAAQKAVREKNSFSVALAGGSTPKALYDLLASNPLLQAKIPWGKIQFFFGDERHVAPDHDESNFRMASEAMFSKAPVQPQQVHRIHGENANVTDAAEEYEKELRAAFQLKTGELPRFDLVLLGMGPEGHTASLFPGTKALNEERRLVAGNWVGKLYTDRITLTPPVLNNAARVMFLVHGAEKAPALKAVLEGPYEPDQLPAQIVHPANGSVLWLVDPTAASMLAPQAKGAV
jgi:6-phosphogluconolactonase